MRCWFVPRAGVRGLAVSSFLTGLLMAAPAVAGPPVTRVMTVASTAADLQAAGLQPLTPAPYYEDNSGQEGPAKGADLSNRPTIRVDGKRCYPCPPRSGSEGTQSNAPPTSDNLSLTPQQVAARDPEVAAAAYGGGGYLDLPFIVNQFRMRYDDAYDDNAPDRAEYFYAKCGCFRSPNAGRLQDPHAAGPTNAENQAADYVNYQAVRTYLELRRSRRFSVFVELPVQFDNIHFPSSVSNTGGFADMNAGFKYALLARNDRYLTFQLRTYIPTGNSYQGLGTHHVSLEPSLLYWRTLSDRAFIQGQFTDWTPIGGSDFAGNILEYGGAFGYVVYRRYDPTARSTPYAATLPPQVAPQNYFLITPLLEGVGWTVLSGKQFTNSGGLQSAAGDTIFNLKLGVRFTKGFRSVYTGWAHGMTRDIWYRNMFRLEYRRLF